MSRKRNPSEPLPYYRWFPQSYRASDRVSALTPMQRGIYRELLDVVWMKGFIPASDVVELARMARVPVSVMQRAWPAVRLMFVPLPGLDGECLTSERLEGERTQQDAVRVQQSLAGKRSAALRNARSTPVERPSTSSSSSMSNSSSTPLTDVDFVAIGAPPAPHGAARLSDLGKDMAERVARGEIRREPRS